MSAGWYPASVKSRGSVGFERNPALRVYQSVLQVTLREAVIVDGSIYEQVENPSFYVNSQPNPLTEKYEVHRWQCDAVPMQANRAYFPAEAEWDGEKGVQSQALQALTLRWPNFVFTSSDLRICDICNPLD